MFKMPKDADAWFRYIADVDPIKTKFDLFYLCFVAGLKKRRLETQTDGTEFYETFPREYDGSRYQILALLISAEMNRDGLDFSDQKEVRKMVSRNILADSQSRLSPDGFGKMNGYAAGGFSVIAEHFEDSPRDIDVFLIRYAELIA